MMKHSLKLLVAVATTTLAGCQLYFGEDHDDDNWTYCGQDGYYECNDEDCYWRGPECPAGMDPSVTPPPGQFECTEDEDCAAGCYCSTSGVCEEAGFCTQDSDCGAGYVCDEQRASCEPGNQQPVSCGADNDCPEGQYCNSETLKCEATCFCTNDAEAVAQGFAYCDSSRSTCLPGADPAGECTGTVTSGNAPACPEGQVPLILDGAYTGACEPINQCGMAPACASYQHATDCQNGGCSSSYTGINCRAPDGVTPCNVPSSSCTCESYTFASCSEGSMPRVVVVNGLEFEIPTELVLQ